MPWLFAFDQTNYARWLHVNIWDPNTLSGVHPEVHSEFQAGNFLIHKSSNLSSGMSIDQSPEKTITWVNVSRNTMGLTESPSAFTRWMVAGLELSKYSQSNII